jgi:DNA-binding response OmpR family regulator
MKNMGSSHAGEPGGLPADQESKSHSKRILVVDDDSVIRCFYRDTLVRCGYHVDIAVDGAAGAAALQAASYDLLITDNNMPKVSGVELIQKLRSNKMTLPIIMASGTAPAAGVEIHLAATLVKPFTHEELLVTVKKVLGETNDISKLLEFLQVTRDFQTPPF